MKNPLKIIIAIIIATAMQYGLATAQPPAMPEEEMPEVLTRGPVNEAFAQPVNLEDQIGLIAPTAPPPDIEEIPPAERPEGNQFAWIPGYWTWDSDRKGYIWASGCWRAVPPDMYWVPGYWTQESTGWLWVAGFWSPLSNTEIEYLPPPPALTIEEPPAAPPAFLQDRIWVPPCWYWIDDEYILRSGYWIVAQPDWVWVPSHYVWTPRGNVFAAGHWDYSLERRGVLFAPVFFPKSIYERRGYSYPLSITINMDFLQVGLFSRPQYSHYYFGDYYDSSYIDIGIFPWFEFERRLTWYDPLYTHARWLHQRNEPQWGWEQRREYDRRRSDRQLRPPRTYREMETRMSKMSEPQRNHFDIAVPISRVASLKSSPFMFQKSNAEGRARILEHSMKVQKIGKERSHWESQGPGGKTNQPAIQRITAVPANKQKTTAKKGKGVEIRPSERMKSVPAERGGRVTTPGIGDKGQRSMITPEKQKPQKVSQNIKEQNKAERVKFQTPPVVERQSSVSFQKGFPTPPAEEKNTAVQQKGSAKKLSKQMKGAQLEQMGKKSGQGKDQKESKISPKQQKSKKDLPIETEQDDEDQMEKDLKPFKGHGNNKGN